jgi:hypothetical protein
MKCNCGTILPVRKQLKVIIMLNFFLMLTSAYFFYILKFKTQVATILFLGLTILYTLSVFVTNQNMRNWSGIKI